MFPAWYRPPAFRPSTGLDVVAHVARLHGMTAADLRGPSRAHTVCMVRWRAMKALRERGTTLVRIGELLGGRDHTSVINGLRRLG